MTKDKFDQFVKYLISEIDKYMQNRNVSDQEMIAFINEFSNFKSKTAESDLPESVKSEIGNLEFNYSVGKIERSYTYFFLAYLSLGLWAFIMRNRRKRNRLDALGAIRNNLNKVYRESILQ